MKRFGTALIFLMALALLACGLGSTPQTPLTGNWTAGLHNPDGTAAFGFTAALKQSGQTVGVTEFSFVSPSSCFATGTTATALFTLADTTHGVTSGAFQMTIQSGPSNSNGTNTLALQGTFVGNSISGSWTLTGTGTQCTETENLTSGNFTMIQM
jgi:hypothetical protein